MNTPDRAPGSELDKQIEPFLNHLRAAGYAERTLRKKRTVARAFTQWAKRKQIVIGDLNDNHLTAFIARSPRRCREHVRSEQTAMRLFFRYLRTAGAVRTPNPPQDVSVAADLLSHYEDFLRRDRGLAENSIHVYSPFILAFLAAYSTKTGCLAENAFDPLAIRDFLVTQTHGRSEEYVRLLSIALRSFLRFLFLRGAATRDLSTSVPMVRTVRPPHLRSFLLRKWSACWQRRIGRRPPLAEITRSCSCWPDLACGRERSSRSSLTTFTGARVRSPSTAKAGS